MLNKKKIVRLAGERRSPGFSLWHLSRKGDFQASSQRKGLCFSPGGADIGGSLGASSDRNGPNIGHFHDFNLNKMNHLDCMAEREGSESYHDKVVKHRVSENTPQNTCSELSL